VTAAPTAPTEAPPATPRAGRVARNSLLQAGADAIGKVGAIVLYAVVARKAGVQAFGDFTTAASLSILIMVAAFGMDYRITRMVARGEEGVERAFWSAIVLKLALGLTALAVVAAVAASGPYSGRVLACTVLLGLAINVELAMLTPHAVLRGLEQLWPVANALTLYRLTLSVAGIAMLLAGGSIVTVAAGWLGAALLALGYTTLQLRRLGLRQPFAVDRESLRATGLDSLGLGLAAVLGAALSRLDIVLLGLLKDTEAVALYGGAYRFMESSQFLSTAVALASFPALARLSRTTSPTLGEATAIALKVVLVVTVPLAVGFVVFAQPLLRLVYGPDFDGGQASLQILGPVVITTGVYSLVTFVLSSQERQRPIVVALAACTVVNVLGNLVLIPRMGATGAAIAWAATTVVLGGMTLAAAVRLTGALPLLRTVAGPVLAGGAMTAVAVALGADGLALLASAVVFGATLTVVEALLFPGDLVRVVHALRRRATRP
jgi:O-antigen/teichoic acid export membrane protein